MIEILGLPAFSDNYIWLLLDTARKRCAVVDPGDAAPVLAWLHKNPGWDIEDILTTHHHNDHVGGVAELKQASGARVYGPAGETIPGRDVALNDGDQVTVMGLVLEVIHVPGHTLGHIAFYHANTKGQPAPLLFCGDTLFAAGCGRLFEGTPAQMHHSLSRFAALPDDTEVYCAHEYTLSNLRFAQAVEPDNLDIAQRFVEVSQWRLEGRPSVPSNLALEKLTNPFLRVHLPAVLNKLDERSGPHAGDLTAAFAALRAWKDQF